jgi:hypothetical protein
MDGWSTGFNWCSPTEAGAGPRRYLAHHQRRAHDGSARVPPTAGAGAGRGGGVSSSGAHRAPGELPRRRRDVALQVAFERQTLKPVFSLDRL